MKTFTNDARKRTPPDYYGPGAYGYDKPSKYLFVWSGMLQVVVSQAGSYLLSKTFHNRHCAIYKCEGGCYIEGQGDLVLSHGSCYFDRYHSKKDDDPTKKIAALITDIVLEWDPMDPIDSMLSTAADHIAVPQGDLRAACDKADNGGVFGGNALADFFQWNPFSEPPIVRDYQRFAFVKFNDKSEEWCDQYYADKDLGKELLGKLKEAFKKRAEQYLSPMCCSPSRRADGLRFWINTGTFTKIDGWKTQKEIEDFIALDTPIRRNDGKR